MKEKTGQIITFYSYKGGVGRSMTLANVGTLLAQWGYRVLMVDFDLEAPGLEHFFSSFIELKDVKQRFGLVDFLHQRFEAGSRKKAFNIDNDFVSIDKLTSKGELKLFTAGQRSSSYFKKLRSFDIKMFYEERQGGLVIEDLRNYLIGLFDYVLVDSRTGNTEIGGICTAHLPDILVLLFTATDQSAEGAADIARRALRARQRMPFPRPNPPVLPIASRFGTSTEFHLSQRWLDRFAIEFREFLSVWLPISVNPRTVLELTKVPEIPYFGFGKHLPVLEQGTNDPAGLGYAYETLAAMLVSGLQDIEDLVDNREFYVRRVSRGRGRITRDRSEVRIFLSYSHSDVEYAERIRRQLAPILRQTNASILSDMNIGPGDIWRDQIKEMIEGSDLIVLLLSPDYLASEYVAHEELPLILESAEIQGKRVVSILLRPAFWDHTEIGRFQFLNSPDRPLSAMKEGEQDEALFMVSRKIAEIAKLV